MDSYADRLNKFNDMINTTAEHVGAIQEAATKFRETNDPVGLGLDITGATAGGVSTIAGGIAGINHFKDFKKMYRGITSRLSNVRDRVNTDAPINDGGRGGDTYNADPVQNKGGNVADENAIPSNENLSKVENVDGGIEERINDLNNNPFPTEEANDINREIDSKVNSELGSSGKSTLNNAVRNSGRGGDPAKATAMEEGSDKVEAQKDFLSFKNKVANDSIQRNRTGQPQANSYDRDGNAIDTKQQQPIQNNSNPVQAENNVNLAPNPNEKNVVETSTGDNVNVGQNLDQQAEGIVAKGRQALSNLMGGKQVPGRDGVVQGLKVEMGDATSQEANMGSRVQQNAGDIAQHQLAPGKNTDNISVGNQKSTMIEGNNSGQDGVNLGQGASKSSNIADEIGNAGKNIASDVGEGLEGVSDVLDFASPIAPIVGVVSALVGLGTTIAGLFHHKPPPQKEAPPPPPTSSVGASLKDTVSGLGSAIF